VARDVLGHRIIASLSKATYRIVKERLMANSELPEFKSEFMRELVERGVKEGREEGLRSAIRAVLDARGVAISGEQQRHLDECCDLELLGAWARRAAVARTADEVFASESA
jgi:hypothetical protein